MKKRMYKFHSNFHDKQYAKEEFESYRSVLEHRGQTIEVDHIKNGWDSHVIFFYYYLGDHQEDPVVEELVQTMNQLKDLVYKTLDVLQRAINLWRN